MLQRTLLGAALLGLVGLPYVLSTQKNQPPAPAAGLESLGLANLPPVRLEPTPRLPAMPPAGATAAVRSAGAPAQAYAAARSAPPASAEPPATPTMPTRLDDIFRFELSPDQVMHTWPMVNTVTNQPDLKGYRVALVTGGRADSLAGSLTYFFGSDQQMQRIVFHGTTGEPRPLIQFVAQRFEFKSDPTADAGTQRYTVRWSGKTVSELRVQPAQIIDAGQPLRRFSVSLLIERPQQKSGWFTGGGGGGGSGAIPELRL